MPTLEEYIIMLDNHQLGWNGYTYPNEACKEEEYQLRVMLGADDIDEIINQKLDRQIERIADETAISGK